MNGEKIEGQKLTFSVSEFLTGKQRVEQESPEIDLSRMEEKTELQTNVTRRGGSGMEMEKVEEEQQKGFLEAGCGSDLFSGGRSDGYRIRMGGRQASYSGTLYGYPEYG